jgi:hypothetical protein
VRLVTTMLINVAEARSQRGNVVGRRAAPATIDANGPRLGRGRPLRMKASPELIEVLCGLAGSHRALRP